ncbi:MAG: LAGLIDADG family homing endonuclease [Acidobacteria bacterium]|nr:LAGLIDADG family homing endonuclease [Acidobacteriota bacterium]
MTTRQVRAISRKDSERTTGLHVPDAVGHYLAGFADGEGSFNVSFRPRGDYRQPWKISLCFNVSQRDRTVLDLFREQFGCGTMRQRSDGCWYFEVNTLRDIEASVVPFFERYRFISKKKQRDFAKFIEILGLIRSGKHLTVQGIRAILMIRSDMNDGGKRRHDDEAILGRFGESSETVRRTPETEMRQSELHGDMQSGY